MDRKAVFAHYDKDNIIDDYVIYYLKSLKKLCSMVVFVSCCEIAEDELKKLEGIADYQITEKHDEYDFGSYKRGFFYLKDNGLLDNTDSLIFANDSCYAPLYPFEDVFSKMDEVNCDFWGITRNKFGLKKKSTNKFKVCRRPHVQSYFLVFNSAVFYADCFVNFMKNIKSETVKNDIVLKYEIGLSEILETNGFRSDTYIKDYYNFQNTTIYKWRQLIIKSKCPVLKCGLPRGVYNHLTVVDDWKDILEKYTSYPAELVTKNLNHTLVETRKTNLPFVLMRLFDIKSICLLS